jgi:hypothetical protein
MKKELVRIMDTPYIHLCSDMFEGTLEKVSKNVLSIKEKLASALKNLNDNRTPITDCKEIRIRFYDTYDNIEIGLDCYREKTESEIKQEKENKKKRSEAKKKKQKEKEIKLLQQLKVKYPNE